MSKFLASSPELRPLQPGLFLWFHRPEHSKMISDSFDATPTRQRRIGKLLRIPLRHNLVRRITKINLNYECAFLHPEKHITQLTHTHLSQQPKVFQLFQNRVGKLLQYPSTSLYQSLSVLFIFICFCSIQHSCTLQFQNKWNTLYN